MTNLIIPGGLTGSEGRIIRAGKRIVASSLFHFNDSATPAVDSKGVVNLDVTGAHTFTGTGLTINGNTANVFFRAANNSYHNATTWALVVWYVVATQNNAVRDIIVLGDGTGNGAGNVSFRLREDSTVSDHGIRLQVSDGSTLSSTPIANAGSAILTVGTLVLVCVNYTRIGGVTDNIGQVRWTIDGTTWYSGTANNLRLMSHNSGHRLVSKNNTAGANIGIHATYRQVLWLNGKTLSNADMQYIHNQGPEATVY